MYKQKTNRNARCIISNSTAVLKTSPKSFPWKTSESQSHTSNLTTYLRNLAYFSQWEKLQKCQIIQVIKSWWVHCFRPKSGPQAIYLFKRYVEKIVKVTTEASLRFQKSFFQQLKLTLVSPVCYFLNKPAGAHRVGRNVGPLSSLATKSRVHEIIGDVL